MTRQHLALNTVTIGDARDLIENVKPGSIDLAFLDPDYNQWEELIASGFLDAVYRTLTPTGNILCLTKQPFDLPLRLALDPYFRRELVWTFANGGAWVSKKMPLVSHQKVYWAAPNRTFYFNPRTGMDYPTKPKAVLRTSKVFRGYQAQGRQFTPSDEGTWIRDHYHFNKPTHTRVFTKPRPLVEILLRCFSPEAGTVLDPFFGSGITGEVCIANNRHFIGIEIDDTAVSDYLNRHNHQPTTQKAQA